MRLAPLALVSLVCAGAAFAQIPLGRGQFENGRPDGAPPQADTSVTQPNDCRQSYPEKAKKAFVENFQAASVALKAEEWAAAIGAVALARPHAMNGTQRAALLQIEVAAYSGLQDEAATAEKIEAALLDPCMPAAVHKNYRQMLDKIRAGDAAPEQQ